MKMLKSALFAGVAAMGGFALATAGSTSAEAQDGWQPQRPIEFVIQTSPGGGSDVYARLWIGIIQQLNLSPVPITPVNMPGGGGAVALAYLNSRSGDPHYISPTLNSVVTTALQQSIPVTYVSEDLTPIALLTIDPFLLWTHPSKWSNWEEFQEYCRENRVTSVGTAARTEDEIQLTLLARAANCQDFRYVPMGGGGEVASAIAGQQQDINVNQPSEAMAHYPDRLIPILSFSEERLEAFPDTPTHWELDVGADAEGDHDLQALLDQDTGLHQMRGIVAAPDIPQEAVDFYEDMFRQVFESDQWQEFMRVNAMQPTFMGAEDYRNFLVDFEDNHIAVMRDVFGWELRSDLRERDGS